MIIPIVGGITLLENWFPKGSFHLALFTFSSGYFYKNKYDELPLAFVKNKFRKLIVPMYCWNLFYAVVIMAMQLNGFEFGAGNVTIKKIVYDPWINGQQFILNLGGWFVVPLFLVQVIVMLTRFFTRKWKGIIKDTFLLLFFVSLGLWGVSLANKGYNGIGWFRTITRVFYFIPFYYFGFYFNNYLKQYSIKIKTSVLFAVVFSITLSLIVYHKGTYNFTPSSSDFCNTNAGLVYIVSSLPIVFWVRVSSLLKDTIGKSRIINLIADNSYSIMINQLLGFMLLKFFCAFLNERFALCPGFDTYAFHKNIWYYYIPYDLPQTAILYSFFGIAIPIVMQKVVDIIKESILSLN